MTFLLFLCPVKAGSLQKKLWGLYIIFKVTYDFDPVSVSHKNIFKSV